MNVKCTVVHKCQTTRLTNLTFISTNTCYMTGGLTSGSDMLSALSVALYMLRLFRQCFDDRSCVSSKTVSLSVLRTTQNKNKLTGK